MSSATDDLKDLFGSFTNLAQSAMQLHSVRVEAETNRRALEIGTARYNYLSRFNLPLNDPNRLDVSSEKWRDELEVLQQQTSGYLDSVKDPAIQTGVKKKLESQNQSFMLELTGTLATAERKYTQENYDVALANAMNTGNVAEVKATMARAQELKVWDPVEMQKRVDAYLVPIQAQEFINAESAVEVDTGETTWAGSAGVSTGTVKRARTLNELIDVVSEKDVGDKAVKTAASARLMAMQKANDDEASAEYKNVVEAANKAGYGDVAGDMVKTLAEKYAGKVSDETMGLIASGDFEASKLSAEAGMGNSLNFILATAGAKYDDNGNVIPGSTKKISAALGFNLLKGFYTKWAGKVAGNPKLTEQFEQAEKSIRELMASPGAETDELFDLDFGIHFLKYKAGLEKPAEILAYVASQAGNISASKLMSIYEKLESGGFQSPQVIELMKESNMQDFMVTLANSKNVKSGDFKDMLNQLAKGGQPKDSRLYGLYKEFTGILINEMVNGKYMTPTEAMKKLTDMSIGFFTSGGMQMPKTGGNEKKDNAAVGGMLSKYDSGNIAAGSLDIAGNQLTLSTVEQAYEYAYPIAEEMLMQDNILNKESPINSTGFAPITDKNFNRYIINEAWGMTVYRVTGNSSGILLVPMGYKEKVGAAKLMELVKSGDMSGFTAGDKSKWLNSANFNISEDAQAKAEARKKAAEMKAAMDAADKAARDLQKAGSDVK